MTDLQCCRFCYEAVTSNHAINLFFQKSNLVNLSSRLSELLQLPVSLTDGFSPYTCRLCRDSLLRERKNKAKINKEMPRQHAQRQYNANHNQTKQHNIHRPVGWGGSGGSDEPPARRRGSAGPRSEWAW